MKEGEIPYKMTHYPILSHYYSIYYSNLKFDGSREPLEKSGGFDINFWSLLIDNEMCCLYIYIYVYAYACGAKGVLCLFQYITHVHLNINQTFGGK